MSPSKTYILSKAADNDLEEIFEYSELEFGKARAISYLSELDLLLKQVSLNPLLGRLRPELKPNLRSITKESHVIFYTVSNDHIRIIRVLHGSRDIIKFLDTPE